MNKDFLSSFWYDLHPSMLYLWVPNHMKGITKSLDFWGQGPFEPQKTIHTKALCELFWLWTFTKVHSKVERTFVKLHWTFHVEFELFTSLSSPSLRTLSFCEEDVTFEEKLFKLNCKLCFGEEKKVGNDSKLFEKSLGLKWGKKLEKYFQLQFSWDVEIFEIFVMFV